MRRSGLQSSVWLGPTSENISLRALNNLWKFHACITNLNNSSYFWSITAGLLHGNQLSVVGASVFLDLNKVYHTIPYTIRWPTFQFPDQRVKGIMRTSGEIDFRFRSKLKITLVESTYPSQRPECSSLSPHFLLICKWNTNFPLGSFWARTSLSVFRSTYVMVWREKLHHRQLWWQGVQQRTAIHAMN